MSVDYIDLAYVPVASTSCVPSMQCFLISSLHVMLFLRLFFSLGEAVCSSLGFSVHVIPFTVFLFPVICRGFILILFPFQSVSLSSSSSSPFVLP